MTDMYEPIRKVLPPQTRIAFTFKEGDRDLVFYTEGRTSYIRHAYFDASTKTLTANNPALDAMMDDGLDMETASIHSHRGRVDRMQLFHDQFRPMNPTDLLLAEVFTGQSTNQGKTNLWKIAIGVEVVFIKPHAEGSQKVFERNDWDLGDEVLRVMLDHPFRTSNRPDADFREDNCRIVLERVGDLFEQAPSTEMTRRFVENIWISVQEHLEIAEYNETLAPFFKKVREASKQLLMR